VSAERYIESIDAQADRELARLERAAEYIEDPAPLSAPGAPEALRRPTPPPQPYPVHALGPILGSACTALQRTIQAPDAICAGSLLAAASLCVQALVDVEIDGRRYPSTLWALSVASSGERKSAVDAEAMRPIRNFEKKLAVDIEPEIVRHLAKMEEWQAKKDAAKKKFKSGPGLAAALEEQGPPPRAPLSPAIIASDFTVEGLTKLLAVGRASMGAFTDEGAMVFGGYGMSKDNAARTAATLSKFWDNGVLDRVRAGDGAFKLFGRRVAMHLMVQPVIVEMALSNEVLAGQGFLARCLIGWPNSTIGNRMYVPVNLRDDSALAAYHQRVVELLGRDFPLAEGKDNELDPPALQLSTEAAERWRQFHDSVELAMKPGGRFSTVHAWASKTPEQAARIAAVLTVFDQPDAAEINADTMDRGIELALWYLGEAVRLVGTAAISPEARNAEALLAWAHEKGHRLLYSTLALNSGPSCLREAKTFREAMEELVRANWATKIDGGAEIDGAQRKHVWKIKPLAEAV